MRLALAALGSALLSAQVPHGVETFDAAWTTIRDSHFDKTMNGVDWDGVRAELRPRAAAAKSDSELRAVIRDMLGRLGQSHFALIPSSVDAPHDAPRGSSDLSGDPGFDVRLVGGELLVTGVDGPASSPCARAGVSTRLPGHRWPICCAGFARSTGPVRKGTRLRRKRPTIAS